MGKSLGNFTTVKDALKTYSPLAIRYFILISHYRSTLDFSQEALDAAEKGLQKIHLTVNRIYETSAKGDTADQSFESEIEAYRQAFQEAMDDDFNTPRAIAATFDFIKKINSWLKNDPRNISENSLGKLIQTLNDLLGGVLGILPDTFEQDEKSAEKMNEVMQLVLDLRNKLRKEKNFSLADEIRNRLTQIGITIKDTPDGSFWE